MSHHPFDYLMVAYGAGRDSTAMLVQMKRLGIIPDHILFADVGSEKQKTYDFIPVMQEWLAKNGMPPITIVRYVPKLVPYRTIEENMVQNATLPAPVFRRNHNCSVKWKFTPQHKWTQQNMDCVRLWKNGQKVMKFIGYEFGEDRRVKKARKITAHIGEQSKYEYMYPLFEEWEWTIERCIEEIKREGLPVPVKSSCYCCPQIKPHEIINDLTPEERGRIMRIEVTAEPYNKKVQGLWGRVRKKDQRPASITEFIIKEGLEFVHPDEFEELPLSPRCNKRKRGYAIQPPHIHDRLSELIGYKPCTEEWEDKLHRQIVLDL